MHAQDHIVFIVDDDARVRDALAEVLSSVGLNPVTFESASAYVEFPRPQVPACLILDMRLPDIDGLELQSQLAGGLHPPIVFISG
ncbi:MAG: response regulator, partial [Polyangiaceae bacterium]